ncbi:MAG: HEPN domain-containing protein [Saprospiraceae bacterium]
MRTSSEIKSLALQRLAEARQLLAMGHFDGAYYMGGYVIELALKAVICKNLDIDELFDEQKPYMKLINLKVHRFDTLLVLSGLQNAFERARDFDFALDSNWSKVSMWKETARYDTGRTLAEAEQFLSAIDDPVNGVFLWFQMHW